MIGPILIVILIKAVQTGDPAELIADLTGQAELLRGEVLLLPEIVKISQVIDATAKVKRRDIGQVSIARD